MDAPFEAKGYWWLPETPEKEIPGTLSFSPGQPLHLELMGALNQIDDGHVRPPEMINPPIIQGILSDGRQVTLQNCLQNHSSINLGVGIATTRFISHIAFVGVHFENNENVKFIGISLCFKYLDEWFGKNAFNSKNSEDGSLVVTYKRPLPIKTLVNDFHIDFECLGPNESFNRHSIKIFQEARIEIWSESEKNIDDFSPIIRLLQYFLTLAMTGPTFVTKAIGKTESAKEEEPDHLIYLPIEIYFPAAGWNGETSELNWFEMLFRLPDIEDRLELILHNWVTKSEIIRPVYDLYFSAIYSHTYPEFELISLTQALETYHRRIFGGKYQPDNEYLDGLYKELVAAIPMDIASDFKDSLRKGKLRYGNEYSFRKRILLLGDHLSQNIKINFLSDKKQQNVFADKVADTRNYFTHYSPELKEKAALRGEELLDLRRKLRLILQVCFLEELGFSFDMITDIFKKNREYRQFISESV